MEVWHLTFAPVMGVQLPYLGVGTRVKSWDAFSFLFVTGITPSRPLSAPQRPGMIPYYGESPGEQKGLGCPTRDTDPGSPSPSWRISSLPWEWPCGHLARIWGADNHGTLSIWVWQALEKALLFQDCGLSHGVPSLPVADKAINVLGNGWPGCPGFMWNWMSQS